MEFLRRATNPWGQAIELLESNLDDDLVSIEPDERINERTLTAIRRAIAAVCERPEVQEPWWRTSSPVRLSRRHRKWACSARVASPGA